MKASGGWIAGTVDYEAEGIPRPSRDDTECPGHKPRTPLRGDAQTGHCVPPAKPSTRYRTPMPEFTPPPPVLDNWRDHTQWDGPVCTECGHPLWGHCINTDLTELACGGCGPRPPIYYDGPGELRVVSDSSTS